MRNPFHFFVELMQQSIWISVWLLFLMIVNIASVAFWDELLAKVILITFMLSAIFMMGLYSRFGFEKILGQSLGIDPHQTIFSYFAYGAFSEQSGKLPYIEAADIGRLRA